MMMVEVHCSRELKVAEQEIDVKGEGAVKGGDVVEGGVVVKGAAKEATLAAAAVTMMMGKATQVLMPSHSGSPGCTCDMTDKSPVDFFQLLIPDDLLQVVVDETNRFTQQYVNVTELTRLSRVVCGRKQHILLLR